MTSESNISSAAKGDIPKITMRSALEKMAENSTKFLDECEAKRVKFSEKNPSLWADLLRQSTPPTLTVCKHLESKEADERCPCGYAGSVWANDNSILFTIGDQRDVDDAFRAPRIPRSAEIATAQLLTCLFNNAEWLVSLAAKAIEARRAETLGSVHESAVP